MARVIEGNLIDPGGRFAIVAGRFNEFIVKSLVEGCESTLNRLGVDSSRVDLIWVPGAYEIPFTCKRAAASGNYEAVIALGAVIRGHTPHFDFVAGEASKGVAQASMATDVPIIFGVLTTNSIEQAVERAGTKAGNAGSSAAMTALEMVSLMKQMES